VFQAEGGNEKVRHVVFDLFWGRSRREKGGGPGKPRSGSALLLLGSAKYNKKATDLGGGKKTGAREGGGAI